MVHWIVAVGKRPFRAARAASLCAIVMYCAGLACALGTVQPDPLVAFLLICKKKKSHDINFQVSKDQGRVVALKKIGLARIVVPFYVKVVKNFFFAEPSQKLLGHIEMTEPSEILHLNVNQLPENNYSLFWRSQSCTLEFWNFLSITSMQKVNWYILVLISRINVLRQNLMLNRKTMPTLSGGFHLPKHLNARNFWFDDSVFKTSTNICALQHYKLHPSTFLSENCKNLLWWKFGWKNYFCS